jgi:Calcium-activated BK potassium channel alpha subunit
VGSGWNPSSLGLCSCPPPHTLATPKPCTPHPGCAKSSLLLLLIPLLQVLRNASVPAIAPFLDPQQDVIASIEAVRLRLLALSCLAPGASTLLANLMRSSGAAAGLAPGEGTKLAGRRWLREYADGAHCELFLCPAGAPLGGLRFNSAAEAVYDASGAMLVGVVQARTHACIHTHTHSHVYTLARTHT